MKTLTSTFAALSDLEETDFLESLTEARKWEKKFLLNENLVRDNHYKWPNSAVNNWGRIWEYPYVMKMIDIISQNADIKNVADVGPGITFFPLWLAQRSDIESIHTIDNDPICVTGNANICSVFNKEGGHKIHSILSDGNDLGDITNNSLDLIYSISVIEHIPNPRKIIKSITQKLKQNGYLVLTFDVALREDFGLLPDQFYDFLSLLEENYHFQAPVRNVHPLDLLTSTNSPVESERRSIVGRTKGLIKDSLAGKLRYSFSDYKLNIGCYGIVLRKL